LTIFVKAGSVIPESPLMQYVGEYEVDELIFQIYYSDYEVNSFYYEDHDDTFAFEQNIYLEKKYVVNGDQRSMTINQTIEGLFTPRYETYDLKIIGLPFAPSKVLIDGREFTDNLELDDLKRLRIKSSKSFKRIEILA
jgi:alpha-glucosidase